MIRPEVLETQAATPSVRSSSGAFHHFDRRTQRQAYQGLSRAAIVYSCVYLLAYGTGWTLDFVTNPATSRPPIHSLAVAAASILGSAFISWKAQRRAFSVEKFCAWGMMFAVLASVGIIAAQWSWKGFLEAYNRHWQVDWICVWILTFPGLLTLTPRQVFLSGLISILLLPTFLFLGLAREGLPVIHGQATLVPAWSYLGNSLTSAFICLGIAVYMSSRIHNLTRDVSRARLLGNYRLDRPIGQGGMGEVWRATHHLLARPAAVKIIRSRETDRGSSASPDATLRRFEREAQATAALTSPHTIEVFDFGINDDGTFYYVMELLEGMDLRSLVEKTGAIPQARCVHFLRQACASLADAHGHGLVHRDVKPANLFTCRRGLEYDFVKVLDFGLVKETREQGDATQLTSEGVTTGTPAFMAPEMAIGDADVDARADLYALGCVGYWLLTGALVFDATSGVAMVVKHARETPIAPSRRTEAEIHPGLDSLILACLAKNRDDRPLGILELDRELGRLQAEIGPWSQERAERWWRTHLPELTALSQTPLQSALPDAPA